MLDKASNVLQKYVSDMAGVLRHVHEAVERQIKDDDAQKFPEARTMLMSLSTELKTQRNQLDGLVKEVDAEHLKGAKEVVTAASGFLTGLYDQLRNHPVSKDLRDDYVAITLCCVAYEMLHTTGLAVQHQPTADLALRHLRQLTPFVTRIGQLMPHVVVKELADYGLPVDQSAIQTATQNNKEAWSRQTV